MRSSFARKVSLVKLFEGIVDVADIEQNMRRDLIVGADLDDVDSLGDWFGGVDYGQILVDKDQMLAADGNDGRRYVRAAELRYGTYVPHFGVTTASSVVAHNMTAIVTENVLA